MARTVVDSPVKLGVCLPLQPAKELAMAIVLPADHVLRVCLKGARDVLEQELPRIAENPAARLIWLDKIFECGATIEVVGKVLCALEHEDDEPDDARYSRITDYCRDQAIKAVRYRSRSTAAARNLYDDCEASEWAAVYEILRDGRQV